MLISMNWIRDFVDLNGLDAVELIDRFTLAAAEVEEIFFKGSDIRGVVAARIESVSEHPKSKKLHLLKVSDGERLYDCVCGAPNVREGMVVPFAKAGGRAGGMDIEEVTLAGYPSQGMCCSEAELGISADHSGLMELPEDTPLGEDIKSVLPMIDDVVFEVDNKSLTNRPDLWGHYGIAREFAALAKRPLKPHDLADTAAYAGLPAVAVEAMDKELLYRYTAIKAAGITRKTSPEYIRVRLFYCGVRAINFLTDLTNYVMLELGQPMHAFDAKIVDRVEIRRFDEPFTFQTLDGVDRRVGTDALMICCNNAPVAIAGIMGGQNSMIGDETDSLLLESANFDGINVRRVSSKLGLRTDASMRFEKILDPELTAVAAGRFVKLLLSHDPGARITSSLTDVYVKRFPEIEFSFAKSYADKMAGIEIGEGQIRETLTGLGFGAEISDGQISVRVPSWRATKDVSIPADIVEEIMRVYGYDNIPPKTTFSPLRPVAASESKVCREGAKDVLAVKFGLHEINSYLWYNADKCKRLGLPAEGVKLVNAQAAQSSVLRGTIIPSLLEAVELNKAAAPEFGLFEIGKVIEGLKPDGTVNEREVLGLALFSKIAGEKELYIRLRDIIAYLGEALKRVSLKFPAREASHVWQHPRNTASVSFEGAEIGFLSVLAPKNAALIDKKARVAIAQIDMALFSAIEKKPLVYQAPARLPGINYDLSLLTRPDVWYADIEAVCAGVNCPWLKGVSVIDRYDGEKPSIAIRLVFHDDEKSLVFDEVKVYVDEILRELDKIGIALKA